MWRIALAMLSLFLLAVAGGATPSDETVRPPPHRSVQAAPASGLRLTLPFREARLCHAGERQCRMASYITWCCRPDQECDYSTVGGCR